MASTANAANFTHVVYELTVSDTKNCRTVIPVHEGDKNVQSARRKIMAASNPRGQKRLVDRGMPSGVPWQIMATEEDTYGKDQRQHNNRQKKTSLQHAACASSSTTPMIPTGRVV